MNKIFLTTILLLLLGRVWGQNNTNSPYSVFGIGELNNTGGGRNAAMGGSGLALRSNLSLNGANPASLTAIEPKTFGFDMGMNLRYSNLENKYKSANVLNGNISWVQIGFPVLPFLSAGLSLNPKSSVGYSIYSTKSLEGTNSSYPVLYTGEGGLSESAFSLGIKCFKNFSLGLSSAFIWGNMNRRTDEFPPVGSISSIVINENINYSGYELRSSFQFYQNLAPKVKLTLGGMAEYSGKLNTESELTISTSTSSSSSELIRESTDIDNMELPLKLGLGMALTFNDKTTVTFDYNRSDWRDANVNLSSKKLNINESYHFGVELAPQYDPAKMRQVTKYQAGAMYQTGYINIYGIPIDSYGITLGCSVPIRRDKSFINISVEAGQQGSLQKMLVRESYLKLNCSFNLWERWFVKRSYD